MKIFNIKYKKESKEINVTCSEYSLKFIKKDIEKMGGKIISISLKKPVIKKKIIDPIEIEKNKYYIAKYNAAYKKHENSRMNTEAFNTIKGKLRELKKEVKTKQEYQEKFEKFLEDNNL